MKTFLTLLSILSVTFATNYEYLETPYQQSHLCLNHVVDGEVYFMCDDNTFWEVYRVDEREQTWGEWFAGTRPPQVTPGTLDNPEDWALCDTVQVYPIRWYGAGGEETHCRYAIHNIYRDTVAFLRPLDLKTLLNTVSDQAHKDGKKEGKKDSQKESTPSDSSSDFDYYSYDDDW
ncbi:MAG: hypothetical protein SP1CHLAM54_06140 [Chlamydiia bacterium]|nr:hypothetical protein [Chlamydiia bacterium]MCH9615524.1 hypothetical protein [Chlamydiia bacterium]MCH9629179.1 hypothetical protein [Chlamydiia bacterium]